MNNHESDDFLIGNLKSKGWSRFGDSIDALWRHDSFPDLKLLTLYEASEFQRKLSMCEYCNGTGWVVRLVGGCYREAPCPQCLMQGIKLEAR